jgi:TonB family protein
MLDTLSKISRRNMRKTFYVFLLMSFALHLISISRQFEFVTNTSSPAIIDTDKSQIKLKLIVEKKKQIVESVQSDSEANLEKIKDRFLSNKKNVFKKETVAANVGKFQNAQESSSGKKGLKSSDSLKKISLKDFALSDLSKYKIKEAKKKGDSENKSNKFIPTKVSQTNDFIDDVPIGELTQLNTSEFKFYGFYYRIKQRLEQHWGNSLREKARGLSRRKISSRGNKITALIVILDSLGRIVKVHLKSTSGVEELDSAAIDSFNKAGPFPNPPKGMLENGKAKIEWGFVVKT